MQADVAIIGGGVLGISLAYHLGQRGRSVIVLERETTPAVHASGKNAGMIRQLYRHPRLTDWASRSISLWPTALREMHFRNTGSLIVGREVPEHHSELFEQREHQGASAVFASEDGLLDSPAYVQSLYTMCKELGVIRRLGTPVRSVVHSGRVWKLDCLDGTEIEAPVLVNAAGAWINDILEPNTPWLMLEANAYARHLLLVHGWPKEWMPVADIGFFWEENAGWYMRHWDSDTRVVSICDEVPAIPESFVPSPDIASRTAEKLLASVPSVAEQLSIGRSWHCFRTYTEDQLPVWGPDPEAPDFFWLAAFGGFGMSTGYAAALDAAKQLCGEDVSIPKDFSPERARLQVRKKKVGDD